VAFWGVNYALHRLAYMEVAKNKCVREFRMTIAFMNKLTTPNMEFSNEIALEGSSMFEL